MGTKQSRPNPRRDESMDPPASQQTETQQTEAQQKAAELSAQTDELLDEMDRAMKAALGFEEDEIVDPDELAKRADELVSGYKQKGGQ